MESDSPPIVGFISAPAWYDPGPAELQYSIEECVLSQQAIPDLQGFNYGLDDIASDHTLERLGRCAKGLSDSGCDLILQVGTPFAWASVESEAQSRRRADAVTQAGGKLCVMNSLAIVDALRAHNIKRLSVCTYYSIEWQIEFRCFLERCGFHVEYMASFSDLGLVKETDLGVVFNSAWKSPVDITKRSIGMITKAVSGSQAIVITGCGVRTLNILCELEDIAQCPVVASDTVLYWSAAQKLGLTLKPNMASYCGLVQV